MSYQGNMRASDSFQPWPLLYVSTTDSSMIVEMGSSEGEQNDEEEGWVTEQEQSSRVDGL